MSRYQQPIAGRKECASDVTTPDVLRFPSGFFLRVSRFLVLVLKLRVAFVPVGLGLEYACGLHHFCVFLGGGQELYADRQVFRAETAGDADGGESGDVADTAYRVAEAQRVVEIGVDGGRGDRQRGRSQHVDFGEDLRHLFLDDVADALSGDEIGRADGFAHVSADAADRVAQLGDVARLNQF